MAEEVTNNEELAEEVSDDQTGGPEEGAAVESITLRELDQIAQIIDLASQRGAFRGGEMSTVGILYDKLATFLQNVKDQQDAAKAAAESEEAPVSDDEAQDGEK